MAASDPTSAWNQLISMSASRPCPFCALPAARVLAANGHALVIRDAFPVTSGHTLVIPKRHVGSVFDLGPEERDALWQLLSAAREELLISDHPDGFNIGINDGLAAGQTVPHLHIHLIPRRLGDQADPRGGVRWIFPDKADYWTTQVADDV